VSGVTGTFLGGPISISAGAQQDASVRVALQGRVNADNVRRAGGPSWMSYLRGSTDWRGTLTLRKKLADLVIESELQGIASALPAPFVKSAGESIPLRIERQFLNARQDRLRLQYGTVASGIFLRRLDGKEAVVERATLRLGEGAAAEPERAGLWIAGTLRALDVDGWFKLMGESPLAGGVALGGMDLVDEVSFLNRKFLELAVRTTSQPGGMQIALAGRDMEGAVQWQPQGKGRLTARLTRLTIPDAKPGVTLPEMQQSVASERTYDLPELDLAVEQFQLGAKALGRLELAAVPDGRNLRIERLNIRNPDGVLQADGVWLNWRARPETRVKLRFDVADAGRMLVRFGYPEGLRRGTAKIEGNLAWSGSPQRIDFPTLSGNFMLDSAKGQFTKLEPGIGKLLGIISLQALPRRISLDFRDIFSDGFAYDQIVGLIGINRGVAATDNLRIDGPAARVQMSGEIDLGRETQKLNVKVIPSLSDSVSLAGALIGGPVAGVATFLAQKILKDPIDQFVAYEYAVSGTWSEPAVARVQRAFAAEPSRPE
jgi:uncharacterized protein (TIGR02099 family)